MNPPRTSTATDQRLVARSRRLAPGIDLIEHLGPGGFAWLDGNRGFVTSGVALTVEPRDALEALQRIDHDTDRDAPVAAGPRAVGALPFDGDGVLTIPDRIVACDANGDAWCTEISAPGGETPRRVALPAPTRFNVASETDIDGWDERVREVLRLIDQRRIDKVVLARAVTVDADAPFDVPAVLRQLRTGQRGCVVYADDGFVGATPELLVRCRGNTVLSRPLAGTATSVEELRTSAKDAHEHDLVVRAVTATLSRCCAAVRVEGPAPLQFVDVAHLATTVTARIDDPRISALDLALALHPTPAVGGTPVDAALDVIRRLEPRRGRYAGPCGWVDASGDGEFVVALRCAEIEGRRARLHAGAGIVTGSNPTAEWAETQSKLEPMLRALVRP